MPNKKNQIISFRVPEITEKILNDLATRRGVSRSELVEQIVLDNLSDYRKLSEDEKEVVEVLREQKEEEMKKIITKRKLKKATYMDWVTSTIAEAEIRKASKSEIVEILESMKPVAELRGKEEDLDKFIEDYKNDRVDLERTKEGVVINR